MPLPKSKTRRHLPNVRKKTRSIRGAKEVINPALIRRGSDERNALAQALRDMRAIDARSARGVGYTGSTKFAQRQIPTGQGWRFPGTRKDTKRIFGYGLGPDFVNWLKRQGTVHVLDVGAAKANYWQPLIRQSRGKIGVSVLNLSRALSPNPSKSMEVRIGAVESKEIGKGKWKAIVSSMGGFEKTPFPGEVLQKLADGLRRGGVLYLTFGRPQFGKDAHGKTIPMPAKNMPQNVERWRRQIKSVVGPNFRVSIRLGGNYRKDVLIKRIK